MAKLTLLVNGTERKVEAEAGEFLLSVLRNRMELTGTKYGCGEGECGACTVLIDGRAVRSCMMPAEATIGQKITTIEGLAKNGALSPLQQAFLEEEAFQCAYCTSGMIMSAVALLQKNAEPDEKEIIDFMDGNICRCGTYSRIVRAIQRAAKAQAPAVAKGASR
jgi:aerobic-type carbon monoxide dehydrogenase small subunit (CoxS/CutS family)